MATKPISTSLYDFLLSCYRLCMFLLIGNPLSMFVFNLLFPRSAAEFANDRNIFGEKIYAFYEYLALKWPFYWAKWWMKLKNLSQYTVEQQVQYLFKVAFPNHTEVYALEAMPRNFGSEKEFWPDAYDKLFFKYGKLMLPLNHKDLGYRDELPDWYHRTVAEFLMQNVRLSYNALQEVVTWAKTDNNIRLSLMQYLASGKLNETQFTMLVKAVVSCPTESEQKMFNLLVDYVERYGISDTHMHSIRNQCSQENFAAVEKAAVYHVQMKALKAFKDTDEGRAAWQKFCQETFELLPEVQEKMSQAQYAIFHNVGHKLCFMAIRAFLSRPDKALWRSVFVKEKDSCQTEEIREFIRSYANLELAYRDALEIQNKASEEA